MSWNFDYDICAIIFISTLIIYYGYRKCLPLTYNKLFQWLMVSSVLVAVTDVVGSVVAVQGKSVSISLIYIINITYYIVLTFTPMIFGSYVAAIIKKPIRESRYLMNYVFAIPGIIVMAIAITTPMTGALFSVDTDHIFHYGNWRISIFIETMFYLVTSGIQVIKYRAKVKKVIRYSIYIYILTTAAGHVCQMFYTPYVQTVSLSATIGLLIMFLAYQNPDYDRDRKTGMYRENGIRKIINEDRLYGKNRPVAGIAFDNYEHIRAVYGEETANEVVQNVAKYLQVTFPENDKFYVHKGRVIAFFDGNIETLRFFRNTITERCKMPFEFKGGDVYLSPVFIFTLEDIKVESFEEFKASMTIAFQRAIEQGKGCVIRLTEEMHQEAIRGIKIDRALKKALSEDSLLVYYQPIYDTIEKRMASAEALVRIHDEELGMIYPDEFIWRAEENGSILSLGEQVFRKVCAFINQHNMEEMGLSFIEINLSPLQCIRKQLALEFEKIIEEYNIDPKYLNLEITETSTGDIDVIRENMNQLSKKGVGFALDDYGTGYSNLVNVMGLPLDIIKIDKSLVWSFFNEGSELLYSVIETFIKGDFKLVMEGVETKEMADKLAEMGCHYEQGFYYSKPIPEEDFVSFVKEYNK
ncbi:MAG: EAL domain-containing protein [Lachnospiraceae bacterium]|nr:EAL domain-containing protein [Lachnospiraceae bacterium]